MRNNFHHKNLNMTIKQEIIFEAGIEKVMDALTSGQQFAAFSGAPAEISVKAGGPFSCFGGMITGINVEIEPSRLVQAWRVANWKPGEYSIVKMEFESVMPNQTKLTLNHSGFPEEQLPHLELGWAVKYWNPLKTYIETHTA